MMKFTNNSDRVFNAVWAGQTTVLNPGDAITVEDAIARKFAKDISYEILLQERRDAEQEAVKNGMKVKTVPVFKGELEKKMNEFLTLMGEESNIERASEKPAAKPKKKKAETADEKPSDEDFE